MTTEADGRLTQKSDTLSAHAESLIGFEHLSSLIPIEEFHGVNAVDGTTLSVVPGVLLALQDIVRGLCRERKRHVILTGDGGVGKTTLVRLLASETLGEHFPQLAESQLVRLDVSNVGPEDSRACLETIVSGLSAAGDCIVCLDGIAALFSRPNGGTNKPLMRTLLSRPGPRIIGIMTDWEYAEHIGSDAQMLPLVTRVRLEEPRDDEALEIVRSASSDMMERFGVSIPTNIVDQAVKLSSTFLLNQRHPSKGINVLWQACENRAYEQSTQNGSKLVLTEKDLIRAVAELTELPEETISGEGAACDFESALRQAVVGQDEATKEVATELRLITSGLTEPDKPASVMMFAGTTGVGKSELAKRIAELYSSSRTVNVYSMGNFTESHSVSGLVGVPPGYVGHEQGGRLINDLNSDPYSVFLLDEAEKCHPNVWKPFLNLFDEGWIVDQRGVKAHADKAIFILTTNAGDRHISQLIKSDKPHDELLEQVRKALSRVRHERSSQVVFPSQFLARIKRIVLFRPLDANAMRGIAERVADRVRRLWLQRQSKEFLISSDVIQMVADRAHELNQRADGQEGGRIVRKLFADLVERTVQEHAVQQPAFFRDSTRVLVEPLSERTLDHVVRVTFE